MDVEALSSELKRYNPTSCCGKMLSRIIMYRIRSRVEYSANISSVQYGTKYVNM